MRRGEREIKDISKMKEILDKCDVCRIGMVIDEKPYVVPMSFGYQVVDDVFEFYFHGAKTGRKVEQLALGEETCLEFDTSTKIVEAKMPCGYSCLYESIIARGIPVFLEGEDKKKGLNILMSQYSEGKDFEYPEKMLEAVAVYKVVVTTITAKAHM